LTSCISLAISLSVEEDLGLDLGSDLGEFTILRVGELTFFFLLHLLVLIYL